MEKTATRGDQPASNRRADTVGSVVGTDVPPYIYPGTNENEKNRFYLSP
ncbi:MAG: hypothetical protein JRH03_17185 [Deltaproteobacteria bacterium]|nr:hypothetical protein [Deltaproteobacteria bacterium]